MKTELLWVLAAVAAVALVVKARRVTARSSLACAGKCATGDSAGYWADVL